MHTKASGDLCILVQTYYALCIPPCIICLRGCPLYVPANLWGVSRRWPDLVTAVLGAHSLGAHLQDPVARGCRGSHEHRPAPRTYGRALSMLDLRPYCSYSHGRPRPYCSYSHGRLGFALFSSTICSTILLLVLHMAARLLIFDFRGTTHWRLFQIPLECFLHTGVG